MIFSSLLFLFRFLPIVLLIYHIVPRTFKNLVLFFMSLIFYAWGEPVYVVLMLFSTVVDFTHGLLVERFLNQNKRGRAKAAVASSVVINLGLLGFFKYADFIIRNINRAAGSEIPLLELALPIGISFYTFQTMSYTIDVYRKEAKAQKNIISFGAYVALFPQLIAGPIVQYKTIARQLNKRTVTMAEFSYGVRRFLIGLGKKVLLANSIGLLWDEIHVKAITELATAEAWLGITAFAFQIYFDFSGYSDMAIGLGRMFGFHFLENFNYPYISKTITEFWRRWHISLSTWFREYVYIPMGGNRVCVKKQIRNIMIVWGLTGIWHGASWNFLIWGLYFGILLLIERFWLKQVLDRLPIWISHIYTIILLLVGWTIFAFDSFRQGMSYLLVMFGFGGGAVWSKETGYYLSTYSILLVLLVIGSTPWMSKVKVKISQYPVASAVVQNLALAAVFLLSTAYLVDATYNPFLYFRF